MIDEEKYKPYLPVNALTAIKVVIEIRKLSNSKEDIPDDESEEWFSVHHSYCGPRPEEEPDDAAGVLGYLEKLEKSHS